MVNKAQLSTIKKILLKNKVILAYIFGSHANNTTNKGSDLDIAVLLPSELDKTERFDRRLKIGEELSKSLKMPIDLIVLNEIRSLFFKFIILKEGRLIYAKNENDHLDYECKLMGEYFDFKPFLELQNKNYVQRSL